MINCIWFRQDLRLIDNPALYFASQENHPLLCLYIFDQNALPKMGSAQKWWLYHSLKSLEQALHNKGLQLHYLSGDPSSLMLEVIKRCAVQSLYWNRCYEPYQLKRDLAISRILEEKNIPVQIFDRFLLQAPWEGLNQKNQPYQVFTQYWKNANRIRQPPALYPAPAFKTVHQADFTNLQICTTLEDQNLLPTQPDWSTPFTTYWTPGEKGAQKNLNTFVNDRLSSYDVHRDRPDISGTSLLSPHLHFGEVSPWTIYHKISEMDRESYIRQLIWRDFSYHLLYHFPTFPEQTFKKTFNKFAWENNPVALKAWQRGKTGYPIVDAGMRELWQTGYMHNRIRMVVASFLTKDLLIHWKAGEQWFWDTLLDADLANNAVSWQWVAGCGVDAAPYFRIFNPVLQGEKFDPEGLYVRKWIPELKKLPNEYIHKPWEAPPLILQAADIQLGKNYPNPIVDHAKARQDALIRYKAI